MSTTLIPLHEFDWGDEEKINPPIIRSSFFRLFVSTKLGRSELWPGRIVAYLSPRGERRVEVIGWEDYRKRYIILRPLDAPRGQTIKRRVTGCQKWLVT
jgi:hypothetical protein